MVSRRSWLLSTVVATGALVVSWTLMPVRQRLTGSLPLPTSPGQTALNGRVKIGADNTVTVMMSKSEMGQSPTPPFHARQALAHVSIEWDHGPNATLNSADVITKLAQTLDQQDGWAYYSHSDVKAALASAAKTISADYRVPYLAHAPMEPMNCTVQFLGGGFGRRLDVDFVGQAAAIARDAGGAPVQTIWSREQDITHDFYRPACVSRFTAGLDAHGALTSWKNTLASQAIVPQVLKRMFKLPAAGPDKTTAEGAFDQPYEWPNARIAHEMVEAGVPVGFWRSVGHSHQVFFKECLWTRWPLRPARTRWRFALDCLKTTRTISKYCSRWRPCRTGASLPVLSVDADKKSACTRSGA